MQCKPMQSNAMLYTTRYTNTDIDILLFLFIYVSECNAMQYTKCTSVFVVYRHTHTQIVLRYERKQEHKLS